MTITLTFQIVIKSVKLWIIATKATAVQVNFSYIVFSPLILSKSWCDSELFPSPSIWR